MLHNMHAVSVCFKCFIRMLQVFYLDLDVAYVLQWLSSVFWCFYRCFSCFGSMLQVLCPNVTYVGLVLHILQWDPPTAATGATLSQRRCPSGGSVRGASVPCVWSGCVGNNQTAQAPMWARKTRVRRGLLLSVLFMMSTWTMYVGK
jgi:hypothetical protein